MLSKRTVPFDTRGMKKQVGKSKLFTKTTLTEIQDKMRNACIKSYNKFYEVNTQLKKKQKGKNQDINVNDMGNYRKIKKQLEQKEQNFEIEKENRSLKYEIELKDNEIDNLKSELSSKDKIIGKLRTEKEKLRDEVNKFKGFWRNLIKHFQNKIGFDKDEHYKYVSDDLYKNGIFDDNDNEIANNVRRKVKTLDKIANLKDRKKNDTRF